MAGDVAARRSLGQASWFRSGVGDPAEFALRSPLRRAPLSRATAARSSSKESGVASGSSRSVRQAALIRPASTPRPERGRGQPVTRRPRPGSSGTVLRARPYDSGGAERQDGLPCSAQVKEEAVAEGRRRGTWSRTRQLGLTLPRQATEAGALIQAIEREIVWGRYAVMPLLIRHQRT
jgi:hypothetical protein